MLEFNWSILWVIVNLLILYFILKRFLFGPITAFMEKRTQAIKNDLENAEEKTNKAARLLEKHDAILKNTKSEAAKILTDAKSRAEKTYDEIVQNAKSEAVRIHASAKASADMEYDRIMKEAYEHICDLAILAASQASGVDMDTKSNQKAVSEFLMELGAERL